MRAWQPTRSGSRNEFHIGCSRVPVELSMMSAVRGDITISPLHSVKMPRLFISFLVGITRGPVWREPKAHLRSVAFSR
jgi:hypothetical protein